jgi:CheY-like chemotaxis protein
MLRAYSSIARFPQAVLRAGTADVSAEEVENRILDAPYSDTQEKTVMFDKQFLQDTRTNIEPSDKRTILIIEDEELLLRILCDFLESQGFVVLTALDGREGYRKFQAAHVAIDLVISDMGLPSVDGLWVYDRMKELKPGVKVIFMTGFTEPRLIEEIKSDGIKTVVQKPFDPFTLLKEVNACLN